MATERPHRRPGPRSGNVFLVASILCLIALMGVSSFFFMARTDLKTSLNLEREILATYLAESIAAQIQARVDRYPWNQRFWAVEAAQGGSTGSGGGLPGSITFDESSGHVDLSKDSLPPESYEFLGIVKDLDAALKTYRIYLEIEMEGVEKYTFAWDKRYEDSVLEGMNRDTSLLDKKLDDVAMDTGPADQLLDEVKKEATQPNEESSIQYRFKELLDQIKKDSDSVESTTTLPPDPVMGPPPPSPSPGAMLPDPVYGSGNGA